MASTLTVDKIKGGSSGVALTLPTTDGSAGQLLKTDGSAVLSWATDTDTTYTASGVVSIDGSNVITSTGEANAANTAITSSAQAFTEDQTFEAITETVTAKSAGFTPDLSNDGTLYSCSGTMTITMPTAESGKSFTIIHATATSITWAGTIKWNGGSAPTADSGIDIYVFVSDGTNWYGMQSGTGFA